jgi:hypothetical protein
MRDPDLINIALIITVAGLLSGHQRTFELSEVLRGTLIHVSHLSVTALMSRCAVAPTY